jgi:release factor glutamine methyltransferase
MQDSVMMVQSLFNQVRNSLLKMYDAREARQLALILLDHYAGIGAKEMIISPMFVIEDQTTKTILKATERLLFQEPIQYITGIAHFCGYEFSVNPDVLIPRPETEEMVHWILEDHSDIRGLKIADIGTGSGCIAISLWLRFQDTEVHAFDFSEPALKVAIQNNDELGSQVAFEKMDFLNQDEWPDQKYDVIVSNPPYIPQKNRTFLPSNVAAYEPADALFVPDEDPLLFYRTLAHFAKSNLNPNGNLYVEVHEYYADQVVELFSESGLHDISLRLDMQDRKRMIKASY